MKKLIRSLALTASLAFISAPAHSLTIEFNDPGVPAEVRQGFEEAAAMWESILSDDVTVRVDIGFGGLPPGVLGSAGSRSIAYNYSTVRAAMIGDASSANDATAVGSLRDSADFDFITRNSTNDGNISSNDWEGNWTQTMSVNSANAKALGLFADDGAADAGITFSSDFTWDFDSSDGIDAGAFDFVGVAAHEIGHALGFVSGVDLLDINVPPNGLGCQPNGCPQELFADVVGFFDVLDLFKYSQDSIDAGGFRDLTLGNLGDVFFSLDGVSNFGGTFSTGRLNCANQVPCQQASHWQDGLGLGLMDPTAARGEVLGISALDLTAFDVIGWDLGRQEVPEPAPLTLLISGLILLGLRRRISSRTQ